MLTAGPTATAGFAANREDVFIRGADRGIWWAVSTDGGATFGPGPGNAIGKFSQVGGVALDSIAAAAQSGAVDIYVWGGDNAIWWNRYTTGGGWAGWTSLGGRTIYAPAASSCSAGHLDVWIIGADGALWQRGSTDSGANWSPWAKVGGRWTSRPSAFCHPGTTNVDVNNELRLAALEASLELAGIEPDDGVSLIASLLAGIYPALRMGRIQPAQAIRSEQAAKGMPDGTTNLVRK